ncbi:MAG: pyridoxal phosphate-dependent aminotransferase [Bacteroidota bacterium]|nr:pyridoxal phosphate-dependent aminotransferase [Bacteroidota bacterium]
MSKGLSEVSVFANLAVGSPDILPPKEINTLCLEFSKNPNFSYGQTKGSVKALYNLHKLVFNENPNINPDKQISLCNGAKFGIYLTLKTICNPKEHIMLLQPYWLSYPDICKSLDLLWSGFEYDFNNNSYNIDALKQSLLSENSKVLLLNNPNNPSGKLLSLDFLKEMIGFCAKHDIWLVLDEVYKDLNFAKQSNIHENLHGDNLIRVGSLSKSIALAGMRIGYVQGSENFISNFNLFNQHISTCINNLSIFLVENISKSCYDLFSQFCIERYKERFEIAQIILEQKGYSYLQSESSFYLLVKVTPHFKDIETAIQTLEEKGIIVTKGEHYGAQFKDFLRICLTIDKQKLVETLNQFN